MPKKMTQLRQDNLERNTTQLAGYKEKMGEKNKGI